MTFISAGKVYPNRVLGGRHTIMYTQTPSSIIMSKCCVKVDIRTSCDQKFVVEKVGVFGILRESPRGDTTSALLSLETENRV